MAETNQSGGWNRPKTGGQSPRGRAVARPSPWRGVLAGFCVIALAGGAAWFLMGRKPAAPEREAVDKEKGRIKEVQPVKAVAPKVEPEPQPTNLVKTWDGKMVEWPPKGAYKDEEGVWRHPGGQMCFDPRAKPNFIGTKTRQIFEHVSENQVANLLTARPGTMYFGTMTMYKSKKFKEDFVNALVSPTDIKEDDSEADKALKNEVRAAMKELAERVKAGEDLGEILTETRKELQRLGQYKQDIVKELKESMKGKELTDEDVKDYVMAANQMLEEKGIAPLSVSDLAIRNLRRNVERMSAREAAAEAAAAQAEGEMK